ncbi:MAG: hypothetical protein RMX96_03810 [Nostoc sp. ChiSLP02]|nr:hypothetical protein [Nostoc sp. DedSLP05]MDZ8097888.1 hypothetical protein [Nostoc sp. DedSLP01]MDZ8183974.1 hypothetical protein [Nostoc sp. ChiSLP02]
MIWVSGKKLHSNSYEIKKLLGQDDFVISYLAENLQDGKNVTIKTLDANLLNQLSHEESDRLHWRKKSGWLSKDKYNYSLNAVAGHLPMPWQGIYRDSLQHLPVTPTGIKVITTFFSRVQTCKL